MDVRITPEDAAAAARVGAGAALAAVIRSIERTNGYPWRGAWIRVHAGLVLFHFRHADDPQGSFRRVPMGLLSLAALSPDALDTLITALFRRASRPGLHSVRLPAEAAAVQTPLGYATYDQAVPRAY